jgi:hypothetical protein
MRARNARKAPPFPALTHEGKTWEQLSEADRYRLFVDNRPLCEALRQDFELRSAVR